MINNNNFVKTIDFDKTAEKILDLIDELGFTTVVPVNSLQLKNDIIAIIRANLENQKTQTYSILSDE